MNVFFSPKVQGYYIPSIPEGWILIPIYLFFVSDSIKQNEMHIWQLLV